MRITFLSWGIFLAALCAALGAVPVLAESSQEIPSYHPYYYVPAEQDRAPAPAPVADDTAATAPSVEVYSTAPAQPTRELPPSTPLQTQSQVTPATVRNLNDELPPAAKTPAPMVVPTSIYAPVLQPAPQPAAPPPAPPPAPVTDIQTAPDVISTSNVENMNVPPPALAPVAMPIPVSVSSTGVPPVAPTVAATVPLPAATAVETPAPRPLTNFNQPPEHPVTIDQLPSYQNTPAYDQHRTWATPKAKDKSSDEESSNYFLDTPSGVDVGLLWEGYHYQEPDAGGTSVNLNGIKYGLDVALTTHFDKSLYGALDIEYARGLSDYHGSGSSDNHLEQLWDVRTLLGDDLVSKTSDFGAALYTGLGYRQLHSNDQGISTDGTTNFLGYRRENQMVYLPLGLKPRLAFDNDSRLEILLEGDILLWGMQTSWLGDTGLGDPTLHNKQDAGSGYGIRTGFMWESHHWGIGPYLNYWNVSASEPKIFASPSSSCGGPACIGTEPTNHTVEYGIQAKYHFGALQNSSAGLQIAFSCASATHVRLSTLRCGSRKTRFSPQQAKF